jgi:hypothetical protein
VSTTGPQSHCLVATEDAVPGDVTNDYYTYDPLGNPIERLRWDPAFQDDFETGNYNLAPFLMDEFAFDAWGNLYQDFDTAWQVQQPVDDDIPHNVGIYSNLVYVDDEVGYRGEYGYQSDPNTGLVLAGHRYYSPFTCADCGGPDSTCPSQGRDRRRCCNRARKISHT